MWTRRCERRLEDEGGVFLIMADIPFVNKTEECKNEVPHAKSAGYFVFWCRKFFHVYLKHKVKNEKHEVGEGCVECEEMFGQSYKPHLTESLLIANCLSRYVFYYRYSREGNS